MFLKKCTNNKFYFANPLLCSIIKKKEDVLMLQPYFAFGVPLFLLVIYLLFALIHRQTTIHYLRFILLLISTFLMVFSFQVLQESWTINPETLKDAAYSPQWLWIPLGIGLILTLYNAWHGLRTMIKYKTDKH
ncbi:hypothetical protein N0Q84_000570 [Enterococcus faecalis]|nr:hypothetical protein [Enterococcus faecalis]